MALSHDAIFEPLNAFFLKLYQTGAGSPVMFRFDRFGSVICEEDFIDPNHRELGYSPNRVTEKFSDLVNHIPSDTGDGMSIIFLDDAVDDAYFFRMLSPAQPCVSGDGPDNQSIIEAFSAIKAHAVKIWQDLKLESSSGLMLQYKPSLAKPESWYDKSAADIWTNQSFSITEPVTPVSPRPPDIQLWRLKLDDATLTGVLQPDRVQLSDPARTALVEHPVPVTNTGAPVREFMAAAPLFAASDRVSSPLAHPMIGSSVSRAPSMGAVNMIRAGAVSMDTAQPAFALHDTVRMQMAEVDVSQRYQLAQAIGSVAPTQPAVTDRVSISFDYCLVNIRRPWYVDAFISDGSWFVPAAPKASITSGVSGSSFHLLPIAFVVIKNLVIEANWAAADMATAANATDFGPFKITSGIVQNKLSHEGTQVIGWLVQNMPDLPPNNPPT